MSHLPDQYKSATLVNGKPTATFSPAPFHRTITNIVVGNSVQGSVTVYRGIIGSTPIAQNPLGISNTLSGNISLPAGQTLFVVWQNVGTGGASDAFARVSYTDDDNPLGDNQAWSVDLVTIITLPTGASSGARIVLDGSNDVIQMFDASGHLVAQLDPTGLTVGNNLASFPAANLIRMNVTDGNINNPSLEVQPGTSFAGNWFPGAIGTFLGAGTGTPAEQQVMSLQSPSNPGNTNLQSFVDLWSQAHDGSAAGQTTIKMFADEYHIDDSNGDLYLAIDKAALGGDFLINQGGLRITETPNAFGGDPRMGMVTLVGGTATVNNNTVTNNTRIFLANQNGHGTPGAQRVSSRIPGTSFTITSTSNLDTSDVAWMMIEAN